jgi:WD40 repeat protein
MLNEFEFISSSIDRTIKKWNVWSDKPILNITGHTAPIINIIKINKQEIASCSKDNTIRIWNRNDGRCINIFNSQNINTLARYNKETLISGNQNGSIDIWSIKTNSNIRRFEAHFNVINSIIKFGRNRFVSCSDDESIRIWNIKGVCEKIIDNLGDAVNHLLGFTNYFISSGWDNCVRVWNNNGDLLQTINICEMINSMVKLTNGKIGVLLLNRFIIYDTNFRNRIEYDILPSFSCI